MKWISFFCFIYVAMVENMLPAFLKEKSTIIFRWIKKKNEILNGSNHHDDVYFNFIQVIIISS